MYPVTMYRSVAIFAAALAVVLGQTTEVSQCTVNAGALPINALVVGCDTPPCRLPQLQNVVINIIFRVPHNVRSMTTLATAYLVFLGVTVPVPYPLGENAVTCNFLANSYCPILEGEVLQYELNMFIESAFPVDTSANIEFRIVDDTNTALMCIRVPILITPPVSRAANNATRIADAQAQNAGWN